MTLLATTGLVRILTFKHLLDRFCPGSQQFQFPVSFSLSSRFCVTFGNTVHRLAAKQVLKNLEKSAEILEESFIKNQSLQLALKYGNCSENSFD